MTLCGARFVAGWSCRHNVKPRTPRGAPFPPTRDHVGCGIWCGCRLPRRCRFTGSGSFCSAHFQVGVGAVEESHDADLEVGATTGRRPWSLTSAREMEESPFHGADVLEELQGSDCLIAMRGLGDADDSEVDVHLPRGSVGDSVVVEPVSSDASVAFGEVCRDGRRGSNDLICDGFQRSGNPHCDTDGDAGGRLWGRASLEGRSSERSLLACPSVSRKNESRIREIVGHTGPTSVPASAPRLGFRSTGLLGPRDAGASRGPSVAPSAGSRGWSIQRLRPRRWTAGGLLPRRERSCRRASRGSPVAESCGTQRGAGGANQQNSVPGTPREALFLRTGIARGSGC